LVSSLIKSGEEKLLKEKTVHCCLIISKATGLPTKLLCHKTAIFLPATQIL
jgi:hypothetical protein